ncbi:MAG TPA: beta-propeller fold lactonase family protein [Bryobacteraceae bacterium]|nr:beta-propeller fold lactonase family protein [Bryobacteraceae bacterium]
MISRTCLSVVAAAALWGAGCSRPAGPSYLVYVTNEASGDLTVIDPDKPEPVATVTLGKRPRGIHSAGGMIYVTLSGSPFAPPGVDESKLPPPDKSADGIGVVDAKANKLVRKIDAGSDPEQFAISPDGKTLYVSNEDDGGLSFVDVASGKVVTTLKTGEEPEGVTLSPDGRQVYVTSENDGTVSVIDIGGSKVLKTIKVGRRPRSIAFLPNGTKAYVTNENDGAVTVIDAVRQEAVGSIPLGEGVLPMGLAMTKDGSRLYVSAGRSRKVFVIETASGKVASSFEAGQRPWGIALSPDEKLLFTANGPSNDVSVIDVATQTVLRKVKAGNRPWGVLALSK